MTVKIQGKVIPTGFLKVEGRGTLVGAKDRREREEQTEKLVGDQKTGSKVSPRSRTRQERREQRRCQERSDCQKSDIKG